MQLCASGFTGNFLHGFASDEEALYSQAIYKVSKFGHL